MTAEEEHAGKVVACPGCNGKFQIPHLPPATVAPVATAAAPQLLTRNAAATTNAAPPTPTTSASTPTKVTRDGWREDDHANVNFALSLGYGVLISVLFLVAMVPLQGKSATEAGFGDLFLKRGWVNYAEVFLFLWGLVILAMKWSKTKRQRRAMLLDVVPAKLGTEINMHTVGGFIDHLYKLPHRLRDSLMVNRIRKGMELFEKRNNNSEVATFLSAQSDIDANRVTGSYTLLKVFLWAIPILGFIGTVQGLSQAVSSLSAGSTDPEALKASINNLTSGLGVAFDTTLLGLILSMIMSFPMAVMQKVEEEVITEIDAFCTEKLLPKLNDSQNASDDLLMSQIESVPAFAASLAKAHEHFLVQLKDASTTLKEAGDLLKNRLEAHQAKVESTFQSAVEKLTQDTSKALSQPTEQLNNYFASLSRGVESLNVTLRELGGQTITVKKKGFFSR
jgi:biopolymer transport protein ExbB/TolQ